MTTPKVVCQYRRARQLGYMAKAKQHKILGDHPDTGYRATGGT